MKQFEEICMSYSQSLFVPLSVPFSSMHNTIRYSKTFPNVQENAIIQSVQLINYDDGRNVIFIEAVNKITAITLDQKLSTHKTSLLIKKWELVPGYIRVNIFNQADLDAFRQLIEAIEHMPDEWYNDIYKSYHDFINHKTTNKLYVTHIRDLTTNEKTLYDAIERSDQLTVTTLLQQGLRPNSFPSHKNSPLLTAVWRYIEYNHQLQSSNNAPYVIVKLLLDYGADINAKDLCGHTALSLASTHNEVQLADLLLKYDRKVQFATCDIKNASHPDTIVKLNQHFSRISRFSQLNNKEKDIKTEVRLTSPLSSDKFLAKTEVKRGKFILQVETFLTSQLPHSDIEQLLKLYQANFSAESESTPELQRKHFYEKLDINMSEQVYIDVIKSDNKIIGFNLYKRYQHEFHRTPYQLVYCSLAYIDKAFRGTRVMSLLSFRGPFALKEAHPDLETYIFYDAIHPNSYRQAWNLLPRYPECRVEGSLDFIKQVTAKIYSEKRAQQYDGKANFFWPTDARVESAPIKLTEYDLPCVIEKFDEITQGHEGVPGKGGVPVMIPVTSSHFKQMEYDINQKLNGPLFSDHVKQFASIAFANNNIQHDWNDSTQCLWPNNPIINSNLNYA